jgi:hypothetical protein
MGSYSREAYNITNWNEKMAVDRSYSEEGGSNPLKNKHWIGIRMEPEV